jgi:hypothetical protein
MLKRAETLRKMQAAITRRAEAPSPTQATPVSIPLEKPVLMLPAPVKDPVMVAISAMALLRSCERAAETVPSETVPAERSAN